MVKRSLTIATKTPDPSESGNPLELSKPYNAGHDDVGHDDPINWRPSLDAMLSAPLAGRPSEYITFAAAGKGLST
jgi:hypothetical protein